MELLAGETTIGAPRKDGDQESGKMGLGRYYE